MNYGAWDTSQRVAVRVITPVEARQRIGELSDVLIDCVEGGASVGFMTPLSRERADAFWNVAISSSLRDERVLMVAEDTGSAKIVGTVQLIFAQPENQPHRGDVAKMLVRRASRNKGTGESLVRMAEEVARKSGRTLLVLDTASVEAERVYQRCGWTRVGEVPGYALWPDGRPCSTSFYYKQLG